MAAAYAQLASLSGVASRAAGALLGAAVGDAAGGVLEFAGKPSDADVAAALTMPGGGVWQLAPGQARRAAAFLIFIRGPTHSS